MRDQVDPILVGYTCYWGALGDRVADGCQWGGMGTLVAFFFGGPYVLGTVGRVQELEYEGGTLDCLLHGCSIAVPCFGDCAEYGKHHGIP